MRRREFITLLGGAAAWPIAARAQQSERMRRIGVLLPAAPDDAEFQSWVGAFLQGLAQSGWITGRNIRIETRWTKFDTEDTRKYAAELVALGPDVILATGTSTVGPLLRLTRTVPIVFPLATDPVAAGLVASLARPGGNVTGFMSFEIGVSAKWLELLKEIAPGVKRAAVLRDAAVASGIGQFAAIQGAGSVDMELSAINLRDTREIERAVAEFAQRPNGGLIVTASQFGTNHPGLRAGTPLERSQRVWRRARSRARKCRSHSRRDGRD
jgi:putative ABC transport system substrate-binding protein